MDYSFTEEQEMLRTSFQDFFKKENPVSLVREIQEQKIDYSQELYRKMTRLGWMGLMIPEEYGGCGGNWVDMAIFYEEAGKALLPGPHYSTIVIGAQAILTLGSEPQDLSGWVLKDIDEGYPSFTFPSYVLALGASIRVYTNEIHPEWGGFRFGYGKAVWNNKDPDTAALYNAQGQEVARKSY